MPNLSLTDTLFRSRPATTTSSLCDVWGVVHNSIVASRDAHQALSKFRAKGGAVVLITNAPRPAAEVKQQLDRMDVPHTPTTAS